MAGTLLHITLADAILDGARLSARCERTLKSHLAEYRLGSVLIDLPFYDQLIRNGVRKTLGKPVRFNKAGSAFHLKAPSELLLALLDRADTPAKLAVALGHATHYAVDLIFHKEISEMIQANPDRPDEGHLHKRIEDQLDLHVSYDLIGLSGMGSGYAAKMFALPVEEGWASLAHGAFDALHPGLVTEKQWTRWLRALRLFGRVSTHPRAPWAGPKLVDDPPLATRALELADSAIHLGRTFLAHADTYLEGNIERAEFLKRIPNRSMADGGEALPAD